MKKFLSVVVTLALVSACKPSHAESALGNTPAQPSDVAKFGAKTPIIAAGERFTCTPTAVYDGDGPVWCKEGPKLRLAGIAAREMDGTCRSNQPCPDATADAAKSALVDLLGGPRGKLRTGHTVVTSAPLSCLSVGHAVGSRTGSWCKLPDGRDLSCAMVASGTVLKWDRYWKDHTC